MSLTKNAAGVGFRVLLLGFLVFSLKGEARAETVQELVTYLAHEHNLVKAAEDDVKAARERARVALGDWFPNLDVTAGYGAEKQVNPTSDNTNQVIRNLDLKISQLLWDFGKTNTSLRKASLVMDQTRVNLDGIRQQLLRRGMETFLNLFRQAKVLDFARRSETTTWRSRNV